MLHVCINTSYIHIYWNENVLKTKANECDKAWKQMSSCKCTTSNNKVLGFKHKQQQQNSDSADANNTKGKGNYVQHHFTMEKMYGLLEMFGNDRKNSLSE